MEISYGIEITNKEDKLLRTAAEALEVMNKALVPGAFLVDTITIRMSHEASENAIRLDLQSVLVEHVPEWFPGARFKTFARTSRRKFDAIVNGTFEYVKESMKVSLLCHVSQCRGSPGDESDERGNVSIARSCLESENQGFEESTIRAATATIYFGEEIRDPSKIPKLKSLYDQPGWIR